MALPGALGLSIEEMSVAVLDFETTGLNPSFDRVVELSVVRVEPGKSPELVLDTLINPERRVAATEIHGIRDEDVRDAPTFGDVLPRLREALAGSVVAAYNAYFDMRFLAAECTRSSVEDELPFLCLMYLRPLLNLGKRCTLSDACRCHSIQQTSSHRSASDAAAAAELWPCYLREMRRRGIACLGDLRAHGSYKFLDSLCCSPAKACTRDSVITECKLRPRDGDVAEIGNAECHHVGAGLNEYLEAAKIVLADLRITRSEILYLLRKKTALGLSEPQIRTVHARVFASVINCYAQDEYLDDGEATKLAELHKCLGLIPVDLLEFLSGKFLRLAGRN